MHRFSSRLAAALILVLLFIPAARGESPETRRLLYVAAPGIRNYLEYGGHGPPHPEKVFRERRPRAAL